MKKLISFSIILILAGIPADTGDYPDLATRFIRIGMPDLRAYTMLAELTSVGARPSGSDAAARAVEWALQTMQRIGLEPVRLEPIQVPHWVRGNREELFLNSAGEKIPLAVTALGGSTATPEEGLTAEVLEVHSVEEATALGESMKGKIVFFNGPMDPSYVNTFTAYSNAADQRTKGPAEASRHGARAAIVRSMTLALDDEPHTGSTRFENGAQPIPAAALSTVAANRLSDRLKKDPSLTVTLVLSARLLPEEPSANVVGEIRGSEKPNEIVLVGAHLDSWDKGTGAHDDGAGCAHVLEAMRMIRALNLKPKRTIRAVLFMNEEFGLTGAKAYAASMRSDEKHIVAIETDAGGFTPRGFSIEAKGRAAQKILQFARWLKPAGAGDFSLGKSGADISELVKKGVPGIGFMPDTQRYFDLHHSHNDTLDRVNPRELQLGAASIATLAYIIAQEGL